MSGGEADYAVGLRSSLTSGDHARKVKTLAVKDGDGARHAPKKGFGCSVFCLKLFTEKSYITSFSNLSLSIVQGPARPEGKASVFDGAMTMRKGLTLRMEYPCLLSQNR